MIVGFGRFERLGFGGATDGIDGAGWRKSTIPFPYLNILSFWNI
jgi:hypothetical protein